MNIDTYFCKNKCCKIYIKPYKHPDNFNISYKSNYRKAGVFIFDPIQNRVLLVQSRGHLFGPPKGTLNIDEPDHIGAIREVKEETGIDVYFEDFQKSINIRNRAIYYYLEIPVCKIKVQDTIKDNDANGITWIKLDCLEQEIIDGNIVLNHHAKIVFLKLLNKKFPKSDWTIVKYKKK